MGQCVNLTLPTLPEVPAFFLSGQIPGIPLPATVGVFCCKFTIPDPGLNLIVQAANVALAAETGALAAEVMAFVIAIDTAEGAVQEVMDQIYLSVDCPLNGA